MRVMNYNRFFGFTGIFKDFQGFFRGMYEIFRSDTPLEQNNELKKLLIEYKTRYEREKDKKLKIYRYINYIKLSIFYGLEKFSAI